MVEDSLMENEEQMTREIKHPFWANDEKTQIICQFHYSDGRVLEAAVSDTEEGNPDWKEIIDTFGIEAIDASTEKFATERENARKLKEQQQKESEDRAKADALFTVKLEAFEIPEIKNSKDRISKSNIRKAKSIMEVQVLTTALYLKELENGDTE